MKTNSTKKWMKVAGLTLAIGTFAFSANAQRTSTATNDFTKNANAAPGTFNGSVRVVDNKGTIKYIQAANGLTTITNTTANVTTTTWQLGGTLTDNTYIDAAGKVFALDGVSFASGPASTNAADKTVHTGGTPSTGETAATGTGWTLLVRDEATGAIQKLLFTDLVKGGVFNKVLVTGDLSGTAYEYSDATIPASAEKVSVYRNGVKLLAKGSATDYDYEVQAGATATDPNKVVVKKSSTTTDEDYALLVGDRIEIQWVK